MSDKEVISGGQLTLLIFTFILATATLFLPSFVTQNAGRDGWLSVIAGGMAGVLVILLVTAVGIKFPGKTLIEYSETILGKWAGKTVGIIFLLFYLHISAIIAREISMTIHGALLPKTSLESITVIIFLTCAYTVKKGLETITRANVLSVIFTYIAAFVVLLLLLKDLKLNLLSPFLDRGIVPVLQDAVTPAAWFGEIVSIAFLMPFVNKPNETRKHSLIGIIWATATLTVIVGLNIVLFGPKLTSLLTFPTLEAVRYINVSDYIQRVEILFLIPWITSNYIKISFSYYITVLIASRLFKVKSAKTLVFPIGLVIFPLSLALFNNSVDLIDFLNQAAGFYSLPIVLGIPTILFAVELLRKKGGSTNEKPS
jgi:spore germination protein KB